MLLQNLNECSDLKFHENRKFKMKLSTFFIQSFGVDFNSERVGIILRSIIRVKCVIFACLSFKRGMDYLRPNCLNIIQKT